MKLLDQLTDDGFHEAAGVRELLDDPGRTWIGHVRPQRGLQINADGRQFGLKKGANIALVAHHQAPNAIGQFPQRLALITRSGRHRAGGDHPVESDPQMTVKPMVILFFCRTVAQIRDLGEPPALLGAGQAAHEQGTAIDQANEVG